MNHSRAPFRVTRRAASLLALLLVGAVSACGAGDLFRLVAAVTREFGPSNISISNSHLTVTLQSAQADSSEAAQAARARRVAELVRDRYSGYAKLDDISVVFQSHTQYGPVGLTRGQGSYTFTRAELGAPRH